MLSLSVRVTPLMCGTLPAADITSSRLCCALRSFYSIVKEHTLLHNLDSHETLFSRLEEAPLPQVEAAYSSTFQVLPHLQQLPFLAPLGLTDGHILQLVTSNGLTSEIFQLARL